MAELRAGFHEYGREELYEQIVRVLDHMPEDLREIFVMAHYQNRSPIEMAEITGLAAADLKSTVSEANRVFYRSLHHAGR